MATNMERLPELLGRKARAEANLKDILGAFRDRVKAMREEKDRATGKSVAEMIEDGKKALRSLEVEIATAWQFPHQENFDFEGGGK